MSEGEEETESQVQAETQIQTETEEESYPEPVNTILDQVIAGREAMGEHWAVGYEDLATGEVCGYHDADVMQSASVVKLFIMGAVYRYMCYPPEGEEPLPFGEEYEGQLREVINSMITVSDNDAANLLVDRLGGGDFAKGAELIAEFCKENGYVGTSVGRRFLESNPTGDNYTTAADTRKFLSDLYHGKLVNEEASAKMLEIVKGQTLRNKIPSGLPEGFASGNKTGEMPEGYGLGCIENDVAIVFPPEGQGEGYILTVLSNDLAGRNSEAIEAIRQISSLTAQWYQGQQQS
jgi:N-acetylmuramoyl-L-alanine amidase